MRQYIYTFLNLTLVCKTISHTFTERQMCANNLKWQHNYIEIVKLPHPTDYLEQFVPIVFVYKIDTNKRAVHLLIPKPLSLGIYPTYFLFFYL